MSFSGKVLIADDEPHIRKFVGMIVKTFGTPTIFEAGDGAEAVRVYERERPSLVLLDINMPVLDGVGALGKIMEHNPEAVIIMLTSLANRQTVEQCIGLGASDYIRKDTPRSEISTQLQGIICDLLADAPSTRPPQ